MIIEEHFNFRNEILEQSKDEEGFINQSLLLSEILPSMMDAKLIDSEDCNHSYYSSSIDNLKLNAYCVNESGERLQLFLIDESSIDLVKEKQELMVSLKSHYDTQFKRGTKFINKAIKRHLNDEVQDSSPAKSLISQVSSSEGIDQFDVIEIFMISLTSTVSFMANDPQPKRIEFENEEINISFTKEREKKTKTILVKKRLVDLNFLFNILISQGNREALTVDFQRIFNTSIEAIKAADEEHFESFLCVLPANMLAGLYKEHSTRLLEKNVRSFLQFRGVNKGIRETIRKEPEKFIAYNNGLTITASSGEISCTNGKIYLKSLTDFQIVNGGQTTATIYFTQKDGFDISKVNVMAKINIAKKTSEDKLEELISNISTYSNAQSRVSKVDLRSRNPQLVKLKSMSESVLSPSGVKWFFERAKGEFNTKMRIAGSNKTRLKKEYPNERRFSKEQLAKYYNAWGDQPYLVKKGGEKVFRLFIEELCGEGLSKKSVEINRTFYEELIAKIILFRKLEKIYGQGKNSMGQIRAAVIPYTIAVVYKYTDGSKDRSFDLLKIWLEEGLEDDLEQFFTDLLTLVNNLIKKYSESDDYGEYSKKKELWDSISRSNEIEKFMNSNFSEEIIRKYTISTAELKRRRKEKNQIKEVDFQNIFHNVLIHTNGLEYYKKIESLLYETLSQKDQRTIATIIYSITHRKDLTSNETERENELINKIRIQQPEVFDQLNMNSDFILNDTLHNIISIYNAALDSGENLFFEFDKVGKIKKNKKYSSVFTEIGKQLEKGISPNIKQIYYASSSYSQNDLKRNKKTQLSEDTPIDEIMMRKMVEWNTKAKILSDKEQEYLVNFAYGLKKINEFHENNLRRHLKKMQESGFDL